MTKRTVADLQKLVRPFNPADPFWSSRDEESITPEEFAASTPLPLTAGIASVPSYPVDAFPPEIAAMVRAVAEAKQVDEAMPGTSALAVLSTCTGGNAEIEIRPGWYETLNTYTNTVAESTERKSQVQRDMFRPIRDVERQLTEAALPGHRDAEARHQIAVKTMESKIRAAAKNRNDVTMQEALDAAAEANVEVPPLPRLIADDATSEAVITLLAEQKGRLAGISTEGGIFETIAGRYNNNVPNMDVWLKSHCGDEIRVDRKGRPPEYIRRPALTLALMIQYDVLRAIAEQPSFHGRGLLARFLYAMPVSRVGYRKIGAPPVPKDVVDAYETHIRSLASVLHGRTADQPVMLTLTPEAHAAIQVIEAETEAELRPDGALADLKKWGGKYVGAVARIAGNLHFAELGAQQGMQAPVGADTVWRAADLGTFYKLSAIAAFRAMSTDPVATDAAYLLGRIRHLGVEVVSERDMHRACQSHFPKRSGLAAAIDRLVYHGYLLRLASTQQRKGGRPASPTFFIHPKQEQ